MILHSLLVLLLMGELRNFYLSVVSENAPLLVCKSFDSPFLSLSCSVFATGCSCSHKTQPSEAIFPFFSAWLCGDVRALRMFQLHWDDMEHGNP